jgi:hypothetical protein
MEPCTSRTNQVCQNALDRDDVAAYLAALRIGLRQVSAAKGRMGGPTPA